MKSLAVSSLEFLEYLDEWMKNLADLPLTQAAPIAGRTVIISVDVINGFCREGVLAGPRVAAIVAPVVSLFERAWSHGVHHILLAQDTHDEAAVEFGAWPMHCVGGTAESDSVDEIKALPFYDQMVILPKNSTMTQINTGLETWMSAHPEVDTYIVVGDVTDICVYLLATFLRAHANAFQLKRRVIVPVDCVETYHRPVADAIAQGGLPHDADLLHAVFLYHMALNGIEVAARII